MNVTSFLNQNVNKYPLNQAIGFKKKDQWQFINWKQLRTIVFKTANALKAAGIQENDRVAIYSENSAEWITFDLAVMSLGAITVPIYGTNAQEQTEYILEDSQSKIILVGSQEQYDIAYEIIQKKSFISQIIVSKKAVWIKEEKTQYLEDFIKEGSEEFEIVSKENDDLATLIYTSGTTGTPKGVMITHGNFTSAFQAHYDFFKFKDPEKEHSMAFLPLTHVFERAWTLLALTMGTKVSVLENPKLIANALQEVRPTMMCAIPRFYQKIYNGISDIIKNGSPTKQKIFGWALGVGSQVAELKRKGNSIPFALKAKMGIADALVFNKIKAKLGGKLWFTPVGGASISPEISQFFDALGIHMTIGYGMTETTATVTCFPLHNYDYRSAGVTIGDGQIKIGDNNEILVKGSGIMKGYYNKPEETAKVFTEDGWLKTGDAGTFVNGTLTITDRIKDLMKTSNGKYIAPQPIENSLGNNNLINQVMLIAEGRPFVTALIVPNFELLQDKLKSLNLLNGNPMDWVKMPEVKEMFTNIINDIQKNLPSFEKVKKFTLLPADFEITSGEITPTLKIKRNIVAQNYANIIEEMYQHS